MSKGNLYISGRVGRFLPPDRLIGWAVAEGAKEPPRVEVLFRGRAIGSGVADQASKARDRDCVFDIRLDVRLSEADIASDDLEVLAHAEGGARQLQKSKQIIDAGTRGSPKRGARELTSVSVEVGTVSEDGVAIIGRSGFIFLIGGNNQVGAMYSTPDAGISDRWLDLVQKRADTCSGLGANFLQVFVPEKSTALPELFPAPISVPSPLYASLKSKIASDPTMVSRSLFFEDELSGIGDRKSVFRKTDTHLTASGAQLLFDSQLRRLAEHVFYRVGDSVQAIHECDLGEKFSSPKILEEVEMFEGLYFDGQRMNPDLVHEYLPESGHNGTLRVYRNEHAPVRKKVVIFANSFYWGGGSSLGQCWWFSRCFEEFHFVWSPHLDAEYVAKHEPEIVIAQTVERFMRRVPAA